MDSNILIKEESRVDIKSINDLKPIGDNSRDHTLFSRILAALFYGVASFLIIVVNKIVLTNYKFPSAQVLGLGQMVATIVVLRSAKMAGLITFVDFEWDVPFKIFPLPLFYIGNLICGLDGTKHLSLPMFTVLRRFAIFLTMLGEYFILKVHQSKIVVLTVFAMIGGAIIAASNDLAFDGVGYSYVLCNDFFTAANNIYLKKKLKSRDFGRYGLIFYNAVFMIVPLFLLASVTGEIKQSWEYSHWLDIGFLMSYLLSCIMGFALMYSTVLCTHYNSALTTTIVGCLKNILVTYIGMVVGGDYVFSVTNFTGLTISMLGSLVYSYVTFGGRPQKEVKRIPTDKDNAGLFVKRSRWY